MGDGSAVETDQPTGPDPTRIGGRYLVEARLGRGGMGAVYRVRDDTTGHQLALKQMTLSGKDVDAARLRFRREFHTMASLKHPRIVEVFDFGMDDGNPYYTLELLDGQDLHDLDQVPWRRACELLRDVATALASLHARRLLHRDLAPRNVRCTLDGRAKLIDFGVLATAGVSGDIAGTPPFMAPELIHGRPLDQRYDLYGLGALAYRILTGRHAYPARRIEQLETAWHDRPAPPSAIVPDIPPALDALVIALLAHDPLARPASTVEVIDRLAAIGGLEHPAEVDATHGWIASAALVGRRSEMAQLERVVAKVPEGSGCSLLIEAPSGAGKSRLLRELALEAQLAGMCVVRADSDAAGRGPYGIIHELARGVLAAAPAEAEAAARPRAEMLARVISELRARLGVKPSRRFGDPAEDRARLQHELAGWFLAVAEQRPIALVVDDIQRCDEASAAVLATLAHQARARALIVAVALRTDEPVRAPAALAALVDASERIRLGGLSEPDLVELCRSLFGDVPHLPRLAQWMHKVAGGSPLYTTELARHLVDRGVIHYDHGLWTIPKEPDREDLPKGLVEAMDARVRALPPRARSLGEALSVHGGELSLELIVALADTRDEEQVFDALAQLAFEEVLVQGAGTWRFRHDGLREALLRGLTDARRHALHLRVGETLAAGSATSAERDAEIGWHLMRGGDPERGAVRLERAGRALYASQSFSDCIAPLEAALEVIQHQRGSARIRLELQHMLLMAGCMADRKAALRHADACVEGFRYWSGMDVALRATRFVGRHLAVVLGLTWATLRWIVTPRRGPNPYEAFRTFFIVTGYTASVHSLVYDLARTRDMIALVEPVAMLKNRVPWAMYLLTRTTFEFPHGHTAATATACRRILEILESDRLTPIREIDRGTATGGALYLLALHDVMNLEPTLEADLSGLRALGLRFFEVAAEQVRIIQHRQRGEEETAVALEAHAELQFVQLGSIWQLAAFMPVINSFIYAAIGDLLGLRRTIDEMARMCDDGFHFEPFLELARGEYLRERGDAAAARARLEPLIELDYPIVVVAALPAYAETLLVLGEQALALAIATRALAYATAPATFNFHQAMRSIRTLALVEAALGEHAAAAHRLDTALADGVRGDSPFLFGMLHEARARVALAAGDWPAYHLHRLETERRFRPTHNASLIARVQRLDDASRRLTVRAGGDELATRTDVLGVAPRSPEPELPAGSTQALTNRPPRDVRAWVAAVMSGCHGKSERATRALQLVVNELGGTAGVLYFHHQGQLEVAAVSRDVEPLPRLADALAKVVLSTDDVSTLAGEPLASDGVGGDWKPVALRLDARSPFLVGAVAVIAGAIPLVDPDPVLLDAIARAFVEAGDVSLAPTPASARSDPPSS